MPKVVHPNFAKGSGISTLGDQLLSIKALFNFHLVLIFHSMEPPLHFHQHLQDSQPRTGRAPLRIDEMSDRRDLETDPDLQSSSLLSKRL